MPKNYQKSISALEDAHKNLQDEKKLTSDSMEALNAYFDLKKKEDEDKAKLQENIEEKQNKNVKEKEEEVFNLAREYVWTKNSINILQEECNAYTKRVNNHKNQEKEIGKLKNHLSERRQMFKDGIESMKNDIRELLNSNTKKDSDEYNKLQNALEPLLTMDPMLSKEQMSLCYNTVLKPIERYLNHVQTKSSWLMLPGMTGRKRLNLVNHVNNLLRDGVSFLDDSEKIQNQVDAYDKEGRELTGLQEKYEKIDEIKQKLVRCKNNTKIEVQKIGKTASMDVRNKLNEMTREGTKNCGLNKNEEIKKSKNKGNVLG